MSKEVTSVNIYGVTTKREMWPPGNWRGWYSSKQQIRQL